MIFIPFSKALNVGSKTVLRTFALTVMETILPAAPLERSQKERQRKALAGFSPRLLPGLRGREAEREEEVGDRTQHR